MSDLTQCPICQGKWGRTFTQILPKTFDGEHVDCEVCGEFKISGSSLADQTLRNLGDRQRAFAAYKLRKNQAEGLVPKISSDWIKELSNDDSFPSPNQQAVNAIRFIGDDVHKTGAPIKVLPVHFFAEIGSPSPVIAYSLLSELITMQQLTGTFVPDTDDDEFDHLTKATLTLKGWESYEREKRGRIAGQHAFMALKFGDANLEQLLRDVLRPAVKQLSYDLVDMRDSARPGIIDNIMREKIRDAAFVIVDLTHDNSGAYWEAGYAEGLGKPVLYICEKSKFDEKQTHFDTNHSTTVFWGVPKTNEEFAAEVIATLRRSLELMDKA
jgi:hypothetical protein